MQTPDLSTTELLDSFRGLMDTMWVITPEENRVEILRDSMTPEWEGRVLDYSELCDTYMKSFIYMPDMDWWDEVLSLRALKQFCISGQKNRDFDMRFKNTHFGFEWHEAHVSRIAGNGDRPDRIMLTSRFANSDRKAAIVETAVQTEYDYVVYIEADKNSYVMYSSNDSTGTPLPPVASDDYEKEVAEFHRLYVPEEERDSLTQKLSIANAGAHLKNSGEYVIFCTVVENGERRDKKLRFSYFDRAKNIWLLTRTDVTEVRDEKRQRKELQEALQAARVASRAKSDFLSRMSHDIRTPMNAIIGMTTIATSYIGSPERVRDCLEKISVSSKLLLSIINEVLDMSKIESGRILLTEEEVNLADLVYGVVTMVQPQMQEKKLNFNIHINDIPNEIVISDMQRLQQLLVNLLSNSVKYTPTGGSILLEINEGPSETPGFRRYEFAVSDTGIGMQPEFLARVFDPFERANDQKIQPVQGTGLGLSICKSVTELMGGDIKVESVYGEGSRFTAIVYLKVEEEVLDQKHLAGLPVLVADDDEIVCRNTCRRLESMGMKPEWVLSGLEALEKTEAAHRAGQDYFALIIDLKMPGMDGIETTRRIRESLGFKLPIIVISAYDLSDQMDAAVSAGANDFITKPLFCSRLAYKLSQFLEDAPHEPGPAIQRTERQYVKKRVLLAEDNELNQEIAVELLSQLGITVETAENGRIAVEMVSRSPEGYYDLIFMDMQMPVLDGCGAAVEIRALPRSDIQTMPIIAMTANAFADDRRRTRDAGMNEHLDKPIDTARLSEVLHRWLKPGKS